MKVSVCVCVYMCLERYGRCRTACEMRNMFGFCLHGPKVSET